MKNCQIANRIINKYTFLLPWGTLADSLSYLPNTQMLRGWERYPDAHTGVLEIFTM